MHVTKEYAQYIIYSPHIGAKTIKKRKRMINTKYRMVATSVGERSGSNWRGAHKRLEGTGSALFLKRPGNLLQFFQLYRYIFYSPFVKRIGFTIKKIANYS